jgi:hypothetical protein
MNLAGVDASEALLAEHLSAAVRRFGTTALGLVDLPPIETARPTRAELGVAAVLLWAYHVDEAGLLEVVDALADAVATGRIDLPLTGPVARRLIEHRRRRRNERFTIEERRALYERVVGGDLAPMIDRLVQTLAEIGQAGRTQSLRHLQVRAGVAAAELAASMSARATGIAGFAARDIVAQIRDALAILADPELANALGGGGPWTLVARWAPSLIARRVAVEREVQRALAGRTLVEWLARNADRLSRVAPQPGDDVVRAALTLVAEAS